MKWIVSAILSCLTDFITLRNNRYAKSDFKATRGDIALNVNDPGEGIVQKKKIYSSIIADIDSGRFSECLFNFSFLCFVQCNEQSNLNNCQPHRLNKLSEPRE